MVVYNQRFERVEFGPLHKQMQCMGELSQRQLKEGMQIFTEMAAKANIPKVRSRRISMISAKSFKIAASVPQAASG